jgi:hypothetical protein
MSTVKDLTFFNLFGMLTAQRDVIRATGIGIQKNGQMIEKVLQVEKPGAIPELRQGSAAVILFMVHLHEDGKSTIALKDLAGKTPYLENKEIQNVVDLVIKQFQE